MTTTASQITSLTVVYSTVYSDADQRKHQSSASLAFVWGIHRDRWIPRTKGQLRGKCFHLMTSSWREICWKFAPYSCLPGQWIYVSWICRTEGGCNAKHWWLFCCAPTQEGSPQKLGTPLSIIRDCSTLWLLMLWCQTDSMQNTDIVQNSPKKGYFQWQYIWVPKFTFKRKFPSHLFWGRARHNCVCKLGKHWFR